MPLDPPTSTSAASIVAATDFSSTADSGVAWASTLARAHGAPLRLVHATLEAGSIGDYLGRTDETEARLEDRAAARLEATVRKLATEGLEVSWSMERGTPSEVITGLARRCDARLIVIGTRGRRGLAHLLLGSTAERVAQRSTSAVLSIHPGDPPPQWPPRRALVATDFSPESEAALDALIGLLGASRAATLYFVHACHVPYDLGSENPCGSVTDGSELRRGIAADVEFRLQEFAARAAALGLPTETVFCEGHPEEVVVAQSCKLGVDLIVMGTRGRSGLAHVLLGSTAERVIQRAARPVLTSRAALVPQGVDG